MADGMARVVRSERSEGRGVQASELTPIGVHQGRATRSRMLNCRRSRWHGYNAALVFPDGYSTSSAMIIDRGPNADGRMHQHPPIQPIGQKGPEMRVDECVDSRQLRQWDPSAAWKNGDLGNYASTFAKRPGAVCCRYEFVPLGLPAQLPGESSCLGRSCVCLPVYCW